MLNRSMLVLTFALVLASPYNVLHASPPATIGATVQTWHYDPTTNMVTITVVNTSHKNITALNIALTETYADGHVNKHEFLQELVGAIAFLDEVKGTKEEADIRKQMRGDGLFHPGESMEELIGVQPELRDFEAVVDVVTYADSTSEATNHDGLQRIVAHRQADVASKRFANDIINAALADPNDPDPSATAANKIQQRVTMLRAQHTQQGLDAGTLAGVLEELKGISARSNKRDALSQYVAKTEKRIVALAPHAEVKQTSGPQ